MLTLLADLNAPAAVSLGLVPAGLLGVVLAFADADPGYFDPRPAVRLAHQGAVHAGHDLNRAYAAVVSAARLGAHASVEAWRDAVALVLLLTTRPKGALR